MGAEFEEVLVEGQLFRRYTKRDNFPSCRFVEGKARAFTEISTPEKPKKGRLSRDTAGDVKRNADIYTVAGKNLKIELTKNLPANFDWKAPDVEDKLESNREALSNCFPDWVSMELKEGLMDILNQNVLLQKMSGNQLAACIDKADRNLVVTPTPKSWSIVFTDANTAEITEVAEVRSYFTVDDGGNPIGETKNALEKGPAFLTITTTQRVSIVEGGLNVNYTQMTNEVQVSEERLCNAVDSLLSDEALGLVDSSPFYSKISDTISNLGASQYIEARALFTMILEHYKGIQSAQNKHSQEDLQTSDFIYTTGQQLLVDADKAAESANTEANHDLATVANHAAQLVQNLIEPTVQSSTVLPSTSQKCSGEDYHKVITKLQGKYDEVVSSATKFLEAVATALMERIIFTVMAFANSGPSLSFVPFILAPCANSLIDGNCGREQTGKMGRDFNGGFFDASKQPPQARDESKLTPLPQRLLSK